MDEVEMNGIFSEALQVLFLVFVLAFVAKELWDMLR